MPSESSDDIEGLLALPEGRRAVSTIDFVRTALSHPGTRHAVGVEGCAAALVARAVALSGRSVLYVTPDLDSARQGADDLVFVSRHLGGLPAEAAESSTLLFT